MYLHCLYVYVLSELLNKLAILRKNGVHQLMWGVFFQFLRVLRTEHRYYEHVLHMQRSHCIDRIFTINQQGRYIGFLPCHLCPKNICHQPCNSYTDNQRTTLTLSTSDTMSMEFRSPCLSISSCCLASREGRRDVEGG